MMCVCEVNCLIDDEIIHLFLFPLNCDWIWISVCDTGV